MVKYKFNDRILSAKGSYRFKIKRLYNSADRYSPKKSYTFDRITLPVNFLQVNISFTIRAMIVYFQSRSFILRVTLYMVGAQHFVPKKGCERSCGTWIFYSMIKMKNYVFQKWTWPQMMMNDDKISDKWPLNKLWLNCWGSQIPHSIIWI